MGNDFFVDLGEIHVTNRVLVRNELGQFANHIEEADIGATEDALEAGAREAYNQAPKRTHRLANSIHWVRESPKNGYFAVAVPYWEIVEKGPRPHDITGRVSFFWTREGRPWTPGSNTIRHPGYAGFHYMEAGLEVASQELIDSMRRRYACI